MKEQSHDWEFIKLRDRDDRQKQEREQIQNSQSHDWTFRNRDEVAYKWTCSRCGMLKLTLQSQKPKLAGRSCDEWILHRIHDD